MGMSSDHLGSKGVDVQRELKQTFLAAVLLRSAVAR